METTRKYLPADLKIENWESVKPYFERLLQKEIGSIQELKEWLNQRSELESALSENMAWRYIRMTCDMENEQYSKDFEYFVSEIEPKITENDFKLNQKLVECKYSNDLDEIKYQILIRKIRTEIELFRSENVQLLADLHKEEKEYGRIASAMTIEYEKEEITLQKAANYLKNANREIRENVYNLIWQRRLNDSRELGNLLLKLIKKRQTIAKNAGFNNFRDYIFKKLGRFDYSVQDCFDFHEAVKNSVVPIINRMHEKRKANLGYETLKPWDLEVDEKLRPALKPFTNGQELIEKTMECFRKVRPAYAEYLEIMNKGKFLDVESRKGKAPGGYNYPLHESNIPFIFMNATGSIRDVETMVHEGGHAIHSFLSKDLELVNFKDTPAEIAELASMSMELISMEHWDAFFTDKQDLKRAKLSQLKGTIQILPWVAMVDKFQHLLYSENPETAERINDIWKSVSDEFESPVVNWVGQENIYNHLWQKQLHVFEVPFYYIEYGIAQLGAIAIWKNYRQNQESALDLYENALKLGYTKPIPGVYSAAGIKFNFSKEYISELMDFVWLELERITNE
ncbi:MAG: M3 family oligoendopeptidase [Bacteroidales bacterium]